VIYNQTLRNALDSWTAFNVHFNHYLQSPLSAESLIIVFTFLDSFRNKSGRSQPIRTKVGTHAQVKGQQRSQNFRRDRLSGGEMGGSKVSPDA